MKKIYKTVSTLLFVGVLASIMSGCAEDNYNAGYNSYDNSYDSRSNADRKLDYAAQDAAYDASSKLSAQDIKNINNLK